MNWRKSCLPRKSPLRWASISFMQRVQAVKITLSTGAIGVFWGPALVESEAPSGEAPTVADVVFESPRFVGGDAVTPPLASSP